MPRADQNARREIFQALKKVRNNPAAKVIRRIKAGDNRTTQAIMELGPSPEDCAVRTRLVQAGLITVLLDFLQHCSTQTFQETLPKGGTLMQPALWVGNLACTIGCFTAPLNTAEKLEELCQNVVKKMGPLIDCMHDETFFQSHEHWVVALKFFAVLLENLGRLPAIAKILLKKEKVLNFTAQSLCFDLYRPDIGRDAATLQPHLDQFTIHVRASAAEVLRVFCATFEDIPGTEKYYCFSDEDMAELHRISQAPAVNSKRADTASGDQTLANSVARATALHNDDESTLVALLFTVHTLSHGIDHKLFGKEHVINLMSAKSLIRTPAVAVKYLREICHSIVIPDLVDRDRVPQTSDRKCADTVDHGLFEMLLLFQANFGLYQPDLVTKSTQILEQIGLLVFYANTNKALKKDMVKFRERATAYLSNPQAKQIAGLVTGILNKIDFSGEKIDACCWCKVVIESNPLVCSACQNCVYCSAKCQYKDWKEGGHKDQCKLLRSAKVTAEEAGASLKKARKEGKLEENLSRASNNTFRKNLNRIMLQASFRDLHILDCLVELDFAQTPTRITTLSQSEFMDAVKKEKVDEDYARSYETLFEKNKSRGCVSATGLVDTNVVFKTIEFDPSSFSFDARSWSDVQQHYFTEDESSVPVLAQVAADPSAKETVIEMLMRAEM